MQLIGDESLSWHGKDVVEFFESPLFRLGDEEEDHDQGDDIETGVKAEGTGWCECGEETREGDREDCGPEEAGCDGPAHTHFSVGEWEDFGGVSEWDGTLSWRVEGCEEVDEESDHAKMG